MKKVIWLFSLSVMLLTQIITPFAYATWDITPVEETVVEEPVVPVEDTANEDEAAAWDEVVIEPEEKVQPEADFSVGGGDKSNPVEQQWTTWDGAQISGWNSEDNHDVAPVEAQSWTTVEANSWDITKLSWDNENLKEEQVEEKIGNWSWEDSKTWLFESIKNFFWIWESKEEEKEQKNYDYETKVITWEAEYDDVKVEVYADTWLFYSWTELIIKAVTWDMYEWVKEVLSWQLEKIAEEEQTVVAFDISFIYSWEEVQPLTWTVQVTFNYEDNEDLKAAEENEEQEVKVYHLNDIDEEGNKIEELTWATVEEVIVNEEKSEEENVMVVEAESFSVYTIVVQVAEEWPLATENQLANFVYGEISINRPSILDSTVYPIEWFTIMDRNLWAISNDRVSTGSYWYHYQWWNNYWFEQKCWTDNCTDSVTSNAKDVTVSWATFIGSVMNNSWYKWTIFIKDGSNKSYDYWKNWDNYSHYDALWWWSGDINYESTKNNITKLYWDDGNDRSLRQWPCPEGWHVPSAWEWSMLFYYWYNSWTIDVQTPDVIRNLYYSYDKTTLNQFLKDFKIPIAGLRNYWDANINPYHAQLWSSSPESTNSKNARTLATMSSYIGTDYKYPRGNGLHVRCFKNTYSWTWKIFTITYDFNWWSWSTASINVLSWEKAEKPTDPIKEWVVFSWWYLSWTDIEYDFTDNVVWNIELYAKWRDKVAILLPWETFNLVIKSIAKDWTTWSVSRIREWDSKITRMQRSGTWKPWIETKISSDDSECPVYAWFSEWILYYFSEAWTIFMNEDSSDMFYYLYSLTNFDLSDFDTSNVTDMSSMFYWCRNLVSVNLSWIDTSNVTNMSYMFSSCNKLESIDLGWINTSSVLNMNSMFSSTKKLENLDLRWLNLSNVTNMSYMFSDWWLISINLSWLDLSSVRDMSYMFSSCQYLENINFDWVDTSSLVDIKFMFSNCNKLTNLDLSGFDVSNVTSMYGLFQNCSSLINLNISNWNTINVNSMNSMFSNCRSLTNLDISNWDTSSLTDMGYMFQNCSSLTNLDLANFDTSKVTSMFRLFSNDNNLTSLNIGNWNTSKVWDMREMFSNCSSLTNLDISNWDTSKVYYLSSMFEWCSSLISLNLSNRDTNRIESFVSMFKWCSSLTNLDISNWNVSNAKYLSSMFDWCSSLTRIYVWKRFRLSSVTSYDNMFNNTINIIWWNWTTYDSSKIDKTYARIDNKYYSWYFTQSWSLAEDIAYLLPWSDFNTKIKSLSAWFEVNNHSTVDSLITGFKRYEWDWIPLNVTVDIISSDDSYVPVYAWFDNWVIYYYSDADVIDLNKNSSYMFDMCTSLVDVDFSNFNASSVVEMNYMFQWCSSLLNMNLSNWDVKSVNYSNYMFSWCENLENVDLSNWNVGNMWWAGYMFNWCTNLTSLKLDWWIFSDNSFWFYDFLRGSSVKKVSAKWWVLPKDFSNRVGNFLQNSPVTEEMDVSNRDLSRTEKLYDLFINTPLKKVVWIKTWTWTNENLWDMSYMFQYAYNIEEVDMSDMDFSKVTTVYEMFQWNSSNWSKLKKINMSNVKFDSLENMEWFCEKCYNVEEVDLSNWNLNTPNTLTNVSYAFYDAHNLKKVNLHNFWKVSSTYNMFHNNYSLTELDLSWFDTSNTTDMALMFYWVTWLNTLDFTYQDTSNVTNMDRMFYDTTNLKTIYVSEKFNTGMVTTSNEMFWWAISLVWWNWTKYDSNNIDVTYARIDNEYQSWYFTDPNHFAVRYLTVTWEELLKQWISAWQTVEELEDSHRSYSYYTSWDLQTWFDFTEPLYGYTEIYVTWDDVKRVIYEYWTWVEEWIISSWSCLIPRDNNWVAQSESCEVVLPELNVLTWYHTPLWYRKWTNIIYPNLTIPLTWDVVLEAKATANNYTVVYQPWEWTWEMQSQEFEYDKAESLNKNKYRKEWYHFSWWIDMLWKEYRDWEKVLNLLTEWVLELTAQWLQNAPAAWWWQSIIPATKEQEHNAAEEKQDDKQESNQDKQQDETVKDESKAPENTNTSNQTTTQQSSNTSSDNSYKTVVDPEIQSAYEWAYERDVTTIPSLDDAMPDGVVKRWHLAKMVVNYATNVLWREIPEKIPSECRWNDWRKDWESEEIKNYAVKSCALWLMWLDMPKFLPNLDVTRAQFGTIMSRLLWWKKYAWWTPYYRKHLNALKENWIMTQIENPERRVELRQWVWLMLMRSAQNK